MLPAIGHGHLASVADVRSHALPVAPGMNEEALATGRQDLNTESAEFRVADFTNELSGLEGIDQTLVGRRLAVGSHKIQLHW